MLENAPAASAKPTKRENPFLNILVNILIPVIILNKMGKWENPLAPEIGLILALAFPIGYGLWDFMKNGRKNFVSLLGIVNVAITGGLALSELEGGWFAVKEAAFPAILGVGVLASQLLGKPFLETMLRNSDAFNWVAIDGVLADKNRVPAFRGLMKQCNLLFATSFFLSSALNLYLALAIFQKIPAALTALERKQMLNEQIAEMTWKGYVVIALPMMVFMMVIFWFLFNRLQKMTDMKFEELTTVSS